MDYLSRNANAAWPEIVLSGKSANPISPDFISKIEIAAKKVIDLAILNGQIIIENGIIKDVAGNNFGSLNAIAVEEIVKKLHESIDEKGGPEVARKINGNWRYYKLALHAPNDSLILSVVEVVVGCGPAMDRL